LRYKKGKGGKGGKREQEEESEDEDEDKAEGDDDDDDPSKSNEVTVEMNSMRLDTVLKMGGKVPRAKVEEAFYNSTLRLNGEKVGKKSVLVGEGDVIDLIKGRNAENQDFLDVVRVEVVSVPDFGTGKGRIRPTVRRSKKMTIENYSIDPFEANTIAPVAKDK
jgi:hypothetical protein